MPGIHRPGERIGSWDDKLDGNFAQVASERQPDYARILNLLRPRVGETLLDVGSGSGKLLSAAVKLGLDPTGIEDTPEAAAISQKTAPEAKVVVGSEIELPFEDNQFDLVTAMDLIEYFPEPSEGLHEIHRILKLGGRACLVLGNAEFIGKKEDRYAISPFDDPASLFLSLKEWRVLLADEGLSIVAIQPNLPQSRMPVSRNPVIGKISAFFIRLFLVLMPTKWSYQFICTCYKD
ncbi:class I SAM-dependent methyltransferase [bacterium]|nr:class I SAM-dependent methyltransferase [bacterium]